MDNSKKISLKSKSRLRTIFPKNNENFNSSKPRVQFYLFLSRNECITTPDNNLYNHIQCAEGNHYIAIKEELLHFGDARCFCFQSDSSFVSK